jgi:hypothetical protein
MCIALYDAKCANYSFYKTKEEHLSGRAAAMARIASLSYAKQKYIAEHYYDDKWPWKEASE